MGDQPGPHAAAVGRHLEVLDRTPDVLNTMLRGLSDGWTRATEGPDTWSPYDNVGHLIHGERADWIPRVRVILERGEARPFEPYDRFAQFEESIGKTMDDLLDEFRSLRAANVATIAGMQVTDADLARRGTHPSLGAVTLGQLLATWVAHDLGHIAQISRVMAKRYTEEVGPWRAYLPVLTRGPRISSL